MANILYLVHRLPYPPNKGDKVRSYHLLKHLVAQHSVFLGTFVDDPDDEQHLPYLRELCADLCAIPLIPKKAKIRSLNGLLAGEPLTLRYYRDSRLYEWVKNTCRQNKIDAIVVFCSAMAQYVEHINRTPIVIDFVDVDSEKWTQYADKHHWPMSWLYRREGQMLLAYERSAASRCDRSFFVTEAEAQLFKEKAPECAVRIDAICNGVDAEYFSPDESRENPFPENEYSIVFTGAMDYLPNSDAVCWFVAEVLPLLQKSYANLRFYIVGRTPSEEVLALASDKVVVTGTVPDVRPYLQYASVVVAPLRIARGIQNKILEAMAMARPVIASTECAAAIESEKGQELLTAGCAAEFHSHISELLENQALSSRIGQAARKRVLGSYSWGAHLSAIDRYLGTQD
jgi:sugar transferase (PEP-CTERM/EpsH1 system associated)